MKVLFILLAGLGIVWAQSDGGGTGPLVTTPPLTDVFPMQETPAGVQMTAPVLLNLNTIIPAHAILRVCYIRPQSSDPVVSQIREEQSSMQGAMTRQTESLKKDAPPPPEVEAAVRIASKTVWPTVVNFRHAFELMNAADMRVVYVDTQTHSFTDEIFNLPEGLLLSEKDGKVVVLAVESHTSGQDAGFLAGDQILEVGGKKLDGTLAGFVQGYRAAQSQAEQAGAQKVIFSVQRKGESEPREIGITRPPSLKGSLLDMN